MTLKLSNFAGSKGGGSSGGHIAANSLFSNADLRVLDLISEGQIGGLVDGAKSIFFNDVPLQNASGTYNFDNVKVDWVNGTPDQRIIEGFNDVTMPQTVGTEVKHGLPVTVAIESTEADKAQAVVSLPSLYSSDSKGNINPTSVTFRFELATNNTGEWTKLGDFTISGKQNSQYSKSYTFNLPKKTSDGVRATKWLLKMTRLSDDSSERYVARTTLDTVYVITSSKLNYPYSALVGIQCNAENLSSIPTRSYLVDGLIIKIPSNYDRKTNTYKGTWDGTFKMDVSDNPAWILYAMLTNARWGLGDFISPDQVNKAKLYEIGRYCDEEIDDGYGKKEKRFAINTQIQERSDAYRVISDIAAVFRGMAYWANGMASFTCDMPTDPSMLYTPANVIDGLFSYQGASRKDRHSVALVTWNDPEQNYKKVVEYVEDAELIEKWGIRQAELTAFGCTSRAQAIRAGRWILYTESYESEVIAFQVGLDSALVLPGDVIKIQDPNYAGKRLGGRLLSVTKTSAILDAKVTLTTSSDAKIAIMMPDGKFLERSILISVTGEYDRVEWNDALPSLPVSNAVWMITEADLAPRIARVVNIQQGDKAGTYKITAVSHQPKKFDLIEKGIKFTEDSTSINDPLNIEAPTNPSVTEVASSLSVGFITSVLNITWTPGKGCVSYEFQWRRENQNETEWVSSTTKQNYVQVTDVQKGTYHFILRGVGLMGNKTAEVEFYYLANGQYVTPLDVLDFEVIKRPSYLEVRWKPVELAFAYEVRCGENWDDGEVLISSFAGTSFIHYQYEAGEYYYHIRSISSTGEYSQNTTTFKLELRAPAMPEDLVATVYDNRVDFTWKANTEDDLSHYELREGASWDSSVKVAESKVNQMSVPGGSTAERKFWLKAIALPKIYSEDAAWCVINVKQDLSRNIILQHNAKTFGWMSNRIHMVADGDYITQEDEVVRSEYIHEIDLPAKLTTQNSFYTSTVTVVPKIEDDEKWQDAKYPWNSVNAQRAWRLGSNTKEAVFENQIARHVGLLYEKEGWTLQETLNSENGIKPSSTTGTARYDWARYTKGLKITDVFGATWTGTNLSKSTDGKFKFSFWLKTSKPDSYGVYKIIVLGNSKGNLTLTYNAGDNKYRLAGSDGKVLTIAIPMKADEYVFFAISQTANKRQLGVGVLNGSVQLAEGAYAPVGNIDAVKVGIHTN